MRIAFVTCGAQRNGREDDALAGDLIAADICVWDDPQVDWGAYDRIVIRSAWDYTARREEFLSWCDQVGPARLRNPPDLVAWNSDKRYLGELPVPTVPTTFVAPGEALTPFDGEVVIKPNVSAGARNTGRFTPDAREEAERLLARIRASGRTALVQPYLPSVDREGETAVVLFGGQVSHVLHKKPVLRSAGIAPLIDAGGPAAVMLEPDLVTPHTASAAQLQLAVAAAAFITGSFGVPLYLRVDMVFAPDGQPVIMELEAIEPALYLSESPDAPQRFATAIRAS